jgi:CBS-domain-containing membrane protein
MNNSFAVQSRLDAKQRLIKAHFESAVHDVLILPFVGVKPDELVEQALLRFAQTTDRELAVEDANGQLIGTLALLDLVLAATEVAGISPRRSYPFDATLRTRKTRSNPKNKSNDQRGIRSIVD